MALHHRLIVKAARLWWRVTKPRTLGVRALLLDDQERVALVRHTYTDKYYLPGGGVKKGESFETACIRELREEVGVGDARIERVLGVYHSRLEGKDDHIVVFVARAGATPLERADAMEIEAAGWFALDALPEATSPATRRRIAEYREGRTVSAIW